MGGKGAVYNLDTLDRLYDLETPSVPNPKFAVGAALSDACWSPDGQRIVGLYHDGTGSVKIKVTYGLQGFRYNIEPKMAFWNASSGALIETLTYAKTKTDNHATLRYSRDGQTLIGEGNPSALFNAATGAPIKVFPADKSNSSFNFDQSLIAILPQRLRSKTDAPVEVRATKSNRLLWRPNAKRASTQWSGTGVLSVSDDRALQDRRLLLWDGQARRVLTAPPSRNITSSALHPRQPWVAVAEVKFADADAKNVASSQLWIWNYVTQKEVWRRAMSQNMNLEWSPDGRFLTAVENAGVYPRRTLWIFDEKGEVKRRSGEAAVTRLAWSPDQRRLAIAAYNRIKIVEIE